MELKTLLHRKSFQFILFFILCSAVSAQNCNNTIHTGEGTFYGGIAGSSGGNCSLPVAVNDYNHCALNNIDYDGSNACGSCIEISGPNGKVKVKVVDRCPECASGNVDMTQQAFAQVANPIDGRVPISWKFVPCDQQSNDKNISINFKSGSSKYWTAIQFRNHAHAISSMEFKQPDGSWKSVSRELFNFFIEPTGISSPMDLRVTSILGEQLIFTNVPINVDSDYTTDLQFTTPASCKDDQATPSCSTSNLAITFDNYPSETSWLIKNSSGTIIQSGNNYGNQSNGSTLTIPVCLEADCYELTIQDTFGDGICCNNGTGGYSLTDSSGNTLVAGAMFGTDDTKPFCISPTANKIPNNLQKKNPNSTNFNGLFIYPNPVRDRLYINYQFEKESQITVTILNVLGAEVDRHYFETSKTTNSLVLNTANLAEGIYFTKISDQYLNISKLLFTGKTTTKRLMVLGA